MHGTVRSTFEATPSFPGQSRALDQAMLPESTSRSNRPRARPEANGHGCLDSTLLLAKQWHTKASSPPITGTRAWQLRSRYARNSPMHGAVHVKRKPDPLTDRDLLDFVPSIQALCPLQVIIARVINDAEGRGPYLEPPMSKSSAPSHVNIWLVGTLARFDDYITGWTISGDVKKRRCRCQFDAWPICTGNLGHGPCPKLRRRN